MAQRKTIKGIKRILHDAVDATCDLVQEGHDSTARNVLMVTDEVPVAKDVVRGVNAIRALGTKTVLSQIKWTNRIVERVTDYGLEQIEFDEQQSDPVPLRSDSAGTKSWWAENAVAALNASVGDYLQREQNPLDLQLRLRTSTRFLDEPQSDWNPKRVALYVHGLGANEWSWFLGSEKQHGDPAEAFPTMLERDLGLEPLFVRYNTGRSIEENGRALREKLTWFFEYHSPEELFIVGHSMGGLVANAAVQDPSNWRDHVKCVVTIGSPHSGAPLAKLADHSGRFLNAIDLPTTKILGRLLSGRSVGVKDLSIGFEVDDHQDIPRVFLSATALRASGPVAQNIGDLLVPASSAHGGSLGGDWRTRNTDGVLHHQVQNHPSVYESLLCAIRAAIPPESSES